MERSQEKTWQILAKTGGHEKYSINLPGLRRSDLERSQGKTWQILAKTGGHEKYSKNLPGLRRSDMDTVSLSGRWQSRESGQEDQDWLEAMVPGCVHTDLLANEVIPDPHIAMEIKENGHGSYNVSLSAQQPALWVWLEAYTGEIRFSGNFIHLHPQQKQTISMTFSDVGISDLSLLDKIKVRSLFDTYQAMG